eukprot:TRINITY_DN10774_c0_g2_i1.p1 TRINITY_DN10774_c0_g2~~TRINITY_DN10774_c0_g2_i1.p1  ORF type:complete len:765 (+),score=253.50 TRINITY_DN10774_c0_g2_i1:299-2296(+)
MADGGVARECSPAAVRDPSLLPPSPPPPTGGGLLTPPASPSPLPYDAVVASPTFDDAAVGAGPYARLGHSCVTLLRAAAAPLKEVPEAIASVLASDAVLDGHAAAAKQEKGALAVARATGRFGDADQHLADLCEAARAAFALTVERLAVLDAPGRLDESLLAATRAAHIAQQEEVASVQQSTEQMQDDIAGDLKTLGDAREAAESGHAAALAAAQRGVDAAAGGLAENAAAQEAAFEKVSAALAELARLAEARTALVAEFASQEAAKRDLVAAQHKAREAYTTHASLLTDAQEALQRAEDLLAGLAAAGDKRMAACADKVTVGRGQAASLRATEQATHYRWYTNLLDHCGDSLFVREQRVAETQRTLEQAVWRKKLSGVTLDHAGAAGCLSNIAEVTEALQIASRDADAVRGVMARAELEAKAVEAEYLASGRVAEPAAKGVYGRLQQRETDVRSLHKDVVNMKDVARELRDHAPDLAGLAAQSEARAASATPAAVPSPRGAPVEVPPSTAERRAAYLGRFGGGAAAPPPHAVASPGGAVPVYVAGASVGAASPSPRRALHGRVDDAAAPRSPVHAVGGSAVNHPSPAQIPAAAATPPRTGLGWSPVSIRDGGAGANASCEELRIRADQLRQAAVESRRRAQCHREQARSMSPSRASQSQPRSPL